MASDKLLMGYVILFMLIFLYPFLNDQIHVIGEHVNATTLEVTLMGFMPTFMVVFIVAYAGLIIYFTVEEFK